MDFMVKIRRTTESISADKCIVDTVYREFRERVNERIRTQYVASLHNTRTETGAHKAGGHVADESTFRLHFGVNFSEIFASFFKLEIEVNRIEIRPERAHQVRQHDVLPTPKLTFF